jgi:hypothetical protein
MAESEVGSRTRVAPARVVLLLLGVVYLVLATGGMFVTGWGEFGWEDPVRLFGVLGTSTLLNIVHGFVGLVALLAAVFGGADAFAPVLGIAFTAMAAFGIVARVAPGDGDPLNLTWGNVVLYLLSVAACVFAYFTRVHVAKSD